MRYFLTHDALATFFSNFPVDKSEDAVVHVERSLPLREPALPLLQPHRHPEFSADIRLLELELGRELLRLHRPA